MRARGAVSVLLPMAGRHPALTTAHIPGDCKEGNTMALARWNPMMPWRPSQEPWSPVTGLESLRSEMDQVFNAFFGTMPAAGANEALWYPRVDLREHDQEFVLVADLPGLKQEDIQVTVENHV